MNPNERLEVISILNDILGYGHNVNSKKGVERKHYCPFCHHHKPKMQINIETQEFHCWVCDTKGKKIRNLLKRLQVDSRILQRIYAIYKDAWVSTTNETEERIELLLPAEFKPLWDKPKSLNIKFNAAYHYLTKIRKLSFDDIRKYNIGYCESGLYEGRIIIPSYDKNQKLNYFISRNYFGDGYKNPPVSRNVIAFENHINWNLPINLVEGGFDAISVKRNSIPLLGKYIPDKLMEAIFENKVTDINIMLDDDAQKQALYYANYFMNQGINVTNVLFDGKDPSELGFEKVNESIKNSNPTNYSDIIKQKLDLI